MPQLPHLRFSFRMGMLLCGWIGLSLGCRPSPDPSSATPQAKAINANNASEKTEGESARAVERADPKNSLPATAPLFEIIKSAALDNIQYRNGEEAGFASILESLGGGIGISDFDLDGQLDIFAPGGGQIEKPNRISGRPTQLVRGLGQMQFADVSHAARIDGANTFTHGVAIADFDNDGFDDCVVTGYGRLQLYHNLGDGTFDEQATPSGMTDAQWSSSAAWCDFNRDGCLDLYVCHYVNWSFANDPYCPGPDAEHREICSPRDYAGLDDTLYISQGDGSFSDASRAWGLVKGGKGLGVVAGDIDADGLPDIYVANDTTENFLYHNRGDHFEEIGQSAGVAYDDEGIPNGSMGVDLADFNGDQLPDLWAANYERESFALYRNEGQANFLHVSRPTGVTALGGLFVGFGTAFVDVDADRDLDVVVTNGHVIKYPQFSQRKQIPLLLLNNQNRFTRGRFPVEHYFMQPHEGRGLAIGDLDNDGHLDLLISHMNQPPALLRSTLKPTQRSLKLELIGQRSNRNAIGAQVVLQNTAGKALRMLSGGGSYLSSHQHVVVFEQPSLDTSVKASSSVEQQLVIRWPSGTEQVVALNSDASGTLRILESIAP